MQRWQWLLVSCMKYISMFFFILGRSTCGRGGGSLSNTEKKKRVFKKTKLLNNYELLTIYTLNTKLYEKFRFQERMHLCQEYQKRGAQGVYGVYVLYRLSQ